MDDIVKRLQQREHLDGWERMDAMRDAADAIKRLTEERNGWQATAAGLSEDIGNAEDEIERLRRLIHEWSDANNFGSLYGDDLTKAVDRVIAAEEMLRKEARRG